MISLTINNTKVKVPEGATILEAAKECGIKIPTLCFVEETIPKGACRVCVVEVKGGRSLMAACSTPAADGMEVLTNSKRAREARQTVIELLLSEHDGNCQICNRNNDCELQTLAREMGIEEIPFEGEKTHGHVDGSTPALVRDSSKCIKCRRCVEVCQQIQNVGAIYPQGRGFTTTIGPAFDCDLEDVACVQCGQCAAICPVGAITEKDQIAEVWAALDDPTKHVIIQTAPAIRAALGECFDMEPGSRVTGKMVTAARQLGFDGVFDTDFAADLTIMEEGTELLIRLKKALVDKEPVALPQYTSCCPGWIKFAEYYHPEMLDNLSTCKSPQQMFGAVAKTYYAKNVNIDPKDMIVVSIMPCTAKKYEMHRPEMIDSGYCDVDYVLTTREFGRMISQAGINFVSLPDGEIDSPLGASTGAADIFANTGGVMEAAIRTAYEIVTGRELPMEGLHIKPIEGLEGIKTASLKIEGTVPAWSFLEGVELKVAVAHGLRNTNQIINLVKSGQEFHFIEVMTCPGGCIGGGGQPRFTDNTVRQRRIEAIYAEDESRPLRKSHENPDVQRLYKDFLKEPLGEKSHHLLHTSYKQRPTDES